MSIKLAFLLLFLALVFPFNTYALGAPGATETAKMRNEKLQNLKQKIQESKAERELRVSNFKKKLAEIRDTKKRSTAQRISTNITNTNTKLTSKMTSGLERLSAIIAEMKIKSELLKNNGKDTSALDQAIADAEAAIEKAKAEVATQSAKQYSATITDESELKNDIGQMTTTFKQDLQGVHSIVRLAKDAVVKASKELGKIKGENEASGSALVQ